MTALSITLEDLTALKPEWVKDMQVPSLLTLSELHERQPHALSGKLSSQLILHTLKCQCLSSLETAAGN